MFSRKITDFFVMDERGYADIDADQWWGSLERNKKGRITRMRICSYMGDKYQHTYFHRKKYAWLRELWMKVWIKL